MNDSELDELGPVDYFVVEFPADREPDGSALVLLLDLIEKGIIRILDQLADESTKVQNIVRGQSRGMVEELARDARSRAAAGDDVVDRFVARLLHRNTNGAGRGSGADLMPKG